MPEPIETVEAMPTRFTITYRDGAYFVSIPRYHGGEVVSAEAYDATQTQLAGLREALRGLADAVDAFMEANVEAQTQFTVDKSLVRTLKDKVTAARAALQLSGSEEEK